jgi:aarF domain-containing kinase
MARQPGGHRGCADAVLRDAFGAVLRGSNKEIVVKVLKPGVEDVLNTDLSFLYVLSMILEFLNPDLSRTSLVPIIGDIRASMLEELDFRKEAANLQQFSSYLDQSGMRAVATCPFVYPQWSTERYGALPCG